MTTGPGIPTVNFVGLTIQYTYSGVFTVIPIYPVAIIKIIENGEFELPKATVKLCVD